MKLAILCCAVALQACLFWCGKVTQAKSTGLVSDRVQRDLHRVGGKGGSGTTQISKANEKKKPHLPSINVTSGDASADGVKRKVMVIQAPVLQMSAATRSQSSISRGESCSPQVIRISLQHLGCKRRVSTTVRLA